jgi:hypothetical protein
MARPHIPLLPRPTAFSREAVARKITSKKRLHENKSNVCSKRMFEP